MSANFTEPPIFMAADYSHYYKKTYMEKLSKKQVLRVTGIGFLSFVTLLTIGSLLVRGIVELVIWSYNGFGLW